MLEAREFAAADVAVLLEAFHADPVRLVPRYLEGIAPMPDGGLVLRFAQDKFPPRFGARLAPTQRLVLRRAALQFVRLVCMHERADHYHALCVSREAAPEVIKENYHLLMALLHPDRQEGVADAWPQAFAQRVNLAYDAIGNDAARGEYDARLERPRQPRPATEPPRMARARANDMRSARTLIAVTAVVTAVMVAGMLFDDDEWGDRTVLQAAFARLGAQSATGSDRPRYVGATAMAPAQRGSDASVDDAEPFAIFKPLMRVLAPEEPKPWVPAPRIEAPAPPAPAPAAAALPIAIAAELPAPATTKPATPVMAASPVPTRVATVASPTPPPAAVRVQVAQAPLPAPSAPAAPHASGNATRPTNEEIEGLVVSLIGYYEAGDAERLMGLLDPDAGFIRTMRMRQAYAEFFRATRARRLRVERLAWNTGAGSAKARGEATVRAEYFGDSPAVERRVDLELDIVLRDGQPRIAHLSLFPGLR